MTFGPNAALVTIAVTIAAGILAQVVGDRWRLPAVVPLLLFGMALGPSGLGLVQPAALGGGLSVIVKLAVAVILFDGALNLRLDDLRRTIGDVRSLITVGLIVTWIGATLTARFIAGLPTEVAIVFGALVTVTGPTVVQPILRRLRISRQLKTILEGEAILIDPVGAVLAVAVVDIVLAIIGVRDIGVLGGVWAYVGRLVVGAATGTAGAILLSLLLRRRGLVPAELVNLVSLAGVWGVFALAESIQSESGIMAAVAMGLVMQRGAVPEERRLRKFKDQLTLLGISLLFVLLSANLPLSVVRAEGVRGLLTVATLMFVVRPASVLIALRKSSLGWRERAFISWISPRGIVAASVASLFALELTAAGFADGTRVLAIAFLTIASTGLLQGLTALPVARMLGLESLAGRRAIIVGAGPMALAVAGELRRYERPVTLIDRNADLVNDARAAGFEAVEGNALDESVLAAAGAEEAETIVAMTSNAEVNALAAHLGHDAFGIARACPVLAGESRGANERLLERVGGNVAFARGIDLREWEHALRHDRARLLAVAVPEGTRERGYLERLPESIVPLARVRQQSIDVATADQTWRAGDRVILLTTLAPDEAREQALSATEAQPLTSRGQAS